MELLGNIMGCVIVVLFISIPVTWVWVFCHKIKCRRVESCANRKCKYWSWCSHNYAERRKDRVELWKRVLMERYGLKEDGADEAMGSMD